LFYWLKVLKKVSDRPAQLEVPTASEAGPAARTGKDAATPCFALN
jgi:hypothetical protein